MRGTSGFRRADFYVSIVLVFCCCFFAFAICIFESNVYVIKCVSRLLSLQAVKTIDQHYISYSGNTVPYQMADLALLGADKKRLSHR